jgi:hypothetical protein
VTGVVLIIVAVTKTLEGADRAVADPAIVAFFKATHRHYDHVSSELTLEGLGAPETTPQHRADPDLWPPAPWLRLRCRDTLRRLRPIPIGFTDPAQTEQLQRDWAAWGGAVELVVLPSPYRSLMEPLLEYIEQAAEEKSNDYVTVILPEFVPKRWWQHLYHNQTSLLIKGALLFRPNIVVTSVPFHLSK